MRRKSSQLKLMRMNRDDRVSRQRNENNYYSHIPYAQGDRGMLDKYGRGEPSRAPKVEKKAAIEVKIKITFQEY